jgi:cobalt transporter subunit CbtA
MFRRILVAALIAGAVAGGLATVLQAARLTPLILVAERYESAGGEAHEAHDHAGHTHGAAAVPWQPAPGTERLAFTLMFNLLAGVGFALLVNAGLALRDAAGAAPDLGTGALWGAAGFASFALAPALGLPPELPGMPSADLVDRQIWWVATALATAIGLALLLYVGRPGPRRTLMATAGVVAIVLPHLIGAPQPDAAEASQVPAELAAQFAVGSLVTAAVFWLVLGSVSGWLQRRLA